MVLISHKHHFIFTKTFKTGGSTVEKYFQQFCLPDHLAGINFNEFYEGSEGIVGKRGGNRKPDKWHSHISAEKLKNQVNEEVWNKYFKFTIVRNPFTKLISAYFFLKELERRSDFSKKLKNRIKWHFPLKPEFYPPYVIDHPEKDIPNFQKWLKKGAFWDDKLVFRINAEICVDYVMKVERLEEEIQTICKKLNLPFNPDQIPKAKSRVKPSWAKPALFYNDEMMKLVKEKYEFELKEFGYEFPDSKGNNENCDSIF